MDELLEKSQDFVVGFSVYLVKAVDLLTVANRPEVFKSGLVIPKFWFIFLELFFDRREQLFNPLFERLVIALINRAILLILKEA